MAEKQQVDIEKWKRKRIITMRIFKLECLLLGMDYSVTFLTLWIYITTLVDTDKPKIFYSLVSASYLLSGVLFSVLIGRWVDRTRSVRLMFLICNCLVIIGNVTYTMHYSPWLLVIGRFVAGIGGPLRSVVSGEVSRCYPSEKVMNKLSAMAMAFSVGFIAGPGINFAFKNVEFFVGSLHVTYANIPGLYMAIIFLIGQIFVMLYVHDLSKEFDLKANEISENLQTLQDGVNIGNCGNEFDNQDGIVINTGLKREISKDQIIINEAVMATESSFNNNEVKKEDKQLEHNDTVIFSHESSTTSSVYQVLLKDLKNFDIVFIFILSFFMYFWIVAFDMWLPMVVIDVLNMGVTELNSIVFGVGAVASLLLLVISKVSFSDDVMFKMSLVCMVALAVMEAIMASMKMFQMKLYVIIILWVIWAILFAIMVLVEEVFLIGVLAKMTASNIQTFNESMRLAMTRFGALTALLVSALVFDYLEYVCLFAIIFASVSMLLLILRRKTFKNPVLKIK